jgi:hypothetical protein
VIRGDEGGIIEALADLIGNCCFFYFALVDMSSYFCLFRVAS